MLEATPNPRSRAGEPVAHGHGRCLPFPRVPLPPYRRCPPSGPGRRCRPIRTDAGGDRASGPRARPFRCARGGGRTTALSQPGSHRNQPVAGDRCRHLQQLAQGNPQPGRTRHLQAGEGLRRFVCLPVCAGTHQSAGVPARASHGAAPDSPSHRQPRGAGPAPGAQGVVPPGQGPGVGHRAHRIGQKHHPRCDGGPHQPHHGPPHPHD